MADMNYVSPLTSDLTDYYTKSEVDELQQGDAATYATSAEIVAGDNAVKGWVASQGYLTEHQDLTNYATKDYVAAAVEDIEAGGVSIEVVATLPAHPEENVIYLTRKNESDTDNIYNEWIWVADTESYELIGDTSSGVIPDLTDYATKDYVDDELANKANTADLAAVATSGDYDDLSNKPTIPSLTGYATETYVDNAVAGISVPANTSDLTNDSGFITSADLPDTSGFVESSDLATVATTGDYDDLINKPTIPVLPTLATVATSGSYNDLSDKPTIPQNTGITSAAGALPLAFIGFDDSHIYCNISRLSNNQDKVKAFNSGYLCRIAANDNIALLPEEAILPGSGNTSHFRSYSVNSNGTYTSGNGSLTNGYYYIYGASIVQRISPNAYIIYYENNQSIAQFYKNILLTYSNTNSGLTATTIQGAIDELAASSGGASTAAQLSYDNTNTWNDGTDTDTVQEAIDALYADVDGLDIPDAVGWSYDSSTGYMTFTGMNDESL